MKNYRKIGRYIVLLIAAICCIVSCTACCAIRPTTKSTFSQVTTKRTSVSVNSESTETTATKSEDRDVEDLLNDFTSLYNTLKNLSADEKETFCIELWNNNESGAFSNLCSELYLETVPENVKAYTPLHLQTMNYSNNKFCKLINHIPKEEFNPIPGQDYFTYLEDDLTVEVVHRLENGKFIAFSGLVFYPEGMHFSGLTRGGYLIFDDEEGVHYVVYDRASNFQPLFKPLDEWSAEHEDVLAHKIFWVANTDC